MITNYEARLRWVMTKSARAACISQLQEIVDMTQNCLIADLRKSGIMRNSHDLKCIVNQIKE